MDHRNVHHIGKIPALARTGESASYFLCNFVFKHKARNSRASICLQPWLLVEQDAQVRPSTIMQYDPANLSHVSYSRTSADWTNPIWLRKITRGRANPHVLSLQLIHPAIVWIHDGKPMQPSCNAPGCLAELAKATKIDVLIDDNFLHPDWKALFLRFVAHTAEFDSFGVEYNRTHTQADWRFFAPIEIEGGKEDRYCDDAAPPPYADNQASKKRPAQAISPRSPLSPAPKRIFVGQEKISFDRGSTTEPNTPTTIDESPHPNPRLIDPPARSPTPTPTPSPTHLQHALVHCIRNLPTSVLVNFISTMLTAPTILEMITSSIAPDVLSTLNDQVDDCVAEAHVKLREDIDDRICRT
ncbi:hypothetical protein ACJQWK_07284 [Exserohilum turcicum]